MYEAKPTSGVSARSFHSLHVRNRFNRSLADLKISTALSLQKPSADSGAFAAENGERLSTGPFGWVTFMGRNGKNSRSRIILLSSSEVCKRVKDTDDLVVMWAEMLACDRVNSRGNFSIKLLTERYKPCHVD